MLNEYISKNKNKYILIIIEFTSFYVCNFIDEMLYELIDTHEFIERFKLNILKYY